MVSKHLLTAALGAALVAGSAHHANAQYGYGFGGWGGDNSAHTAGGDMARGMGVLAAGEGYYNLDTAQARAINANTAANWNEYMYQSQQVTNRKYYTHLAEQTKENKKTTEAIYLRLRDNPNKYDVYRGDALNVIFDELCSPKVDLFGLRATTTKFHGEMIRDVPFQYAAGAITTTVHQVMTKGSAPAALKRDVFRPENQQLRDVGQKIRDENEKSGTIDPETLDEAETLIKALLKKVAVEIPANTKDRKDCDRYLKSALGLSRMLRTPAVNVLLSDAAKHPEASVGDMLAFMKSYNLRFGVADSPREREVYDRLYPLMVKIRDEAFPKTKPGLPSDTPGNDEHPAEFFSNLNEKPPAPPAPARNDK
jgi:hypothetical protein